ncbi:MAG: LysR family transcriptional regulator [Hominimerdicola sp.]
MNLTHLRYMVEVERLGSITKAATALYMGQPNLSKAIKEMEREVGIPIFKRSAKGVVATEKGKIFLQYAKAILVQIDKMEALYNDNSENSLNFQLLLPRASYITYAFTEFLNQLDKSLNLEVKIKETNSMDSINSIVECEYNMGIIRYPVTYESFFMPLIEEKNLKVHNSWEFDYVLITSENSSLVKEKEINEEILDKYVEILHGDNMVPNISTAYQKKNAEMNNHKRHIYVYERGCQFDILASCPDAFMWVSPMPKEILKRYKLVQRRCPNIKKTNKDVLIYQNSYRLSQADMLFLEELEKVRKEIVVQG